MLNKREILKQLEQKAADIETLAIHFINNAPLKYYQQLNTYGWDRDKLPHDLLKVQQKLISNYISWFNSSEELVKKKIPDKIEKFKKYYDKGSRGDGVLDILQLNVSIMLDSREATLGEFRRQFMIQRSIVNSIEGLEVSSTNLNSYLYNLLSRFHIFARQLERKPHNKSSFFSLNLKINNEYDVQHLLHAILKLKFDDIRVEEYTPSYAGGSTKMDFLLKEHQVVIETKVTNERLRDKEIGKQLIEDIAKYTAHQDCKTLYCFIYDPDSQIINPDGLIKDLSKNDEDLNIIIIINPK